MSELLTKQKKFSLMISEFIIMINKIGYTVTLGEALRTDYQAKEYERLGIGTANSLHRLKLAIDLNIFKGETLLTKTEDIEPIGKLWEARGGTWGGRFKDGNHFSLAYNGVK